MNRLFGLVLTALLSLPSFVWAQSDPAALEAYINDHKQVRSLLLARSTLEMSNQLLHDYSKTAAVEYKDLNVELDKYTRAFDVIDVLYQSLRTSMNMLIPTTMSLIESVTTKTCWRITMRNHKERENQNDRYADYQCKQENVGASIWRRETALQICF